MYDTNLTNARNSAMAHRLRGWVRVPVVALLAGAAMAAIVTQGATAATLPGSFRGEAYGTNTAAVVGPIAVSLGKTAYLPCPCAGHQRCRRAEQHHLAIGRVGGTF